MSSKYEISKNVFESFMINESVWYSVSETLFTWYVFCVDNVLKTCCLCCDWLLLLSYHESVHWSVNYSCWNWLLLLLYYESACESVNDDLLKLLMLFSMLKYSFWIQFQNCLLIDETDIFRVWDEKNCVSD